MDDYLAKPVALTQLFKKLDHWLPIPHAEAIASAGLVQAPGATAAEAGTATPVDHSVLATTSGGDAAAERDILLDFRRVNDADAAMLKHAIAQSDGPQVTRATHRIKGASRTVGAPTKLNFSFHSRTMKIVTFACGYRSSISLSR